MTDEILAFTEGKVGRLRLNRPKALNALNSEVLKEVVAAVNGFGSNPGIGAMVIAQSASP